MEPTSLSKNTQNLVDEISGSSTAEHARRSLNEARAGAEDLVSHSSEALRQGATRAREAIGNTTDQAAQYVQAQPLKSLLMALVAGAGIALLASRHHHGRS